MAPLKRSVRRVVRITSGIRRVVKIASIRRGGGKLYFRSSAVW
jgi:hypothetical protein